MKRRPFIQPLVALISGAATTRLSFAALWNDEGMTEQQVVNALEGRLLTEQHAGTFAIHNVRAVWSEEKQPRRAIVLEYPWGTLATPFRPERPLEDYLEQIRLVARVQALTS